MLRFIVSFIWVVLLCSFLGCEKRPHAQSDTLHDLAHRGDVNQVEALLAKGADVNARDRWGNTPLHVAAAGGHEEVVKLLLTKGADINAQDVYGQTPLHGAAEGPNKSMVKLLIESHANLNVVDKEGQTPAALAVDRGYGVLVGLAQTPDVRAMHHGYTEVARILVAAGADATIQLAAYVGDLDRVKSILATGGDVNARDKDGRTALHWAAIMGRKDVAVFLLDHGADLNAREKLWDQTPLHEAASHGQTDVVDAIIAAGADPDVKADGQSTPLLMAASSGHMAVMEFLLAHGANVNAKYEGGGTALDCVVAGSARYPGPMPPPEPDFKEMAELLLAGGAEITDDSESTTNLLVFAARHGLKDLAEKVLAKGNADLNTGTHYFIYNPLLTAISAGQTDIAELLIAAGADVNIRDHLSGDTTLHMAARKNSERLVRLLLAKGINVDTQNIAGETPLHAAAVADSMSMVEFLASQGARVNTADSKGNTPLHYAARESQSMTELLIAKGAVVDAKNFDGDTPLHNAALRGRKEIVQLLLAHGADATAKNNAGKTPLDQAAHRDYGDIVELLRKHMTKK